MSATTTDPLHDPSVAEESGPRKASYQAGSIPEELVAELIEALSEDDGSKTGVPVAVVAMRTDDTLVGFNYRSRNTGAFFPSDEVEAAIDDIFGVLGEDFSVVVASVSADRTRAHLGLAAGTEAARWYEPSRGVLARDRSKYHERQIRTALASMAKPQF